MKDHTFYIIEDDFKELEKIVEEPLLFEAAWILHDDLKTVWKMNGDEKFDMVDDSDTEWNIYWAPAPHFGEYPYYDELHFRIAYKMSENPELRKAALSTVKRIVNFYKGRIPFFEDAKFVKMDFDIIDNDLRHCQESWNGD
jgi:hypothetical protein